MTDQRFASPRFPRSSAYHPEWVLAGASGGAHPLWLTEWLCEAVELQPGMRVLDLGCGRALSSIFLQREFDVQVWATDLWFSAAENLQRVRDAGVAHAVFPLQCNARALPFPDDFFDVVISIDSFMYYGTDDLYLNYLARFVRPAGLIAIAQSGFTQEVTSPVADHLRSWWEVEMPHCLHSAGWWREHWERSGTVDVELADTLPDGWQLWHEWLSAIAPENEDELQMLDADAGRTLGYIRAIGRCREDAKLFDPALSIPADYTSVPLLRD